MHFKFVIIIAFLLLFKLSYCRNLNNTGCWPCEDTWCPKNKDQCPYGFVDDLCGCCPDGMCAKIEGEDCYNDALVPKPPLIMKKYGTCGEDLRCMYSFNEDEYTEKDMPIAICVCEDDRNVCASDNKTYNSICDLNLNKIKKGISSNNITIKNYGPCASAPKITVKPENITTTINNYVLLNCEVHGFPIPEITWEFIPYPGTGKKIKLPSDVLDIAVQTRGGPELFMVTSWVQFLKIRPQDAGVYNCIALNEIGVTTVSAIVTVKQSIHDFF